MLCATRSWTAFVRGESSQTRTQQGEMLLCSCLLCSRNHSCRDVDVLTDLLSCKRSSNLPLQVCMDEVIRVSERASLCVMLWRFAQLENGESIEQHVQRLGVENVPYWPSIPGTLKHISSVCVESFKCTDQEEARRMSVRIMQTAHFQQEWQVRFMGDARPRSPTD